VNASVVRTHPYHEQFSSLDGRSVALQAYCMHHRKAGQETACLSVMHFFWCIDSRGFILWSCVGHVLTWASWLRQSTLCYKMYGTVSTFSWSPCGWEVSPFRAVCRVALASSSCFVFVRSRDHVNSSYSHQHIPPSADS
jgi:hypothetical protein